MVSRINVINDQIDKKQSKKQMKNILIAILIFTNILLVSAQSDKPKVPKGYWNMTTLKLAYVLGRLDLIEEDPNVPDELKLFHDLTYRIADSDTLKLDICYPKKIKGLAPMLVFVYGEKWKHGNKDKYLGYLIEFAKKGYITASMWYRTSGVATFPAAVDDVERVVEWLAANADEYHIDTNNVALIGGSTGGHLALLSAYTYRTDKFSNNSGSKGVNYRIKAVVDLYAPVDLTDKEVIEDTGAEQFIGKPYDAAPELYKKASPVNYVTVDDPPTLIFHGTIDDIVPIEQSEKLKSKLEAAGVPVEYHRMKGWPHFMEAGEKANKYCQFYMTEFFKKYLK